MESALAQLVGTLAATREAREALYVWFHQHPELSLQELQTSSKIRSRLDALQLTHMQVGETGTVCVLENGRGERTRQPLPVLCTGPAAHARPCGRGHDRGRARVAGGWRVSRIWLTG